MIIYEEVLRAFQKEKVKYVIVGGITLPIISIENLIKMKRVTGRTVDKLDI